MSSLRHIFRWDLDKTYLRTDFDSFRGLVRAALESAVEKRAVPGAPALLRALRAAGGPQHRICIISGSPEQMRQVLAAKLSLDGVEFDEFVLKPNLKNFLRGRFRAIRAQVPYKLPALLGSRLGSPGVTPETLFGDDAESDAIVYSVYADLVAGRIDRNALRDILVAGGAYEDQLAHALALAAEVPVADVVKRILIHLDRRSPTSRFHRFGARLVPIYNYFQAALVLYADGQLTARDVLGVAREMLASRDYTLATLANSLQDLLLRRRLSRADGARLAREAMELAGAPQAREWAGDLPPQEQIAQTFLHRARTIDERALAAEVPEVVALDYVKMIAEERQHKKHSRR